MANNQQHHPQSGGFEDQLRRMIISNNPSPPNPGHGAQKPIVRLPPLGSHPIPQNSNLPDTNRMSWNRSGQSNILPNDPSIVVPQNGQASNHHHLPTGRGEYQRLQQSGPSTSNMQPHPQHFNTRGAPSSRFPHQPHQQQRARFQQQIHVDPNAFQRASYGQQSYQRQPPGPQQLFNPHAPQQRPAMQSAGRTESHFRQSQYLEQIAVIEVSNVEMTAMERDEKESFRMTLQRIIHEVCESDPERLPSVSLECFGSFKSGFATAGSDMDLAIVVKDQPPTSACFSLLEDDLPRVLEQRLLQLGYGARLLTRTRVPIIKVCEKPDAEFLDKLREERKKWDDLPPEKKYPHLFPEEETAEGDDAGQADEVDLPNPEDVTPMNGAIVQAKPNPPLIHSGKEQPTDATPVSSAQPEPRNGLEADIQNGAKPPPKRPEATAWTRERKAGPLDFPNTGVGIQSDINFFNPLGLHNTQLLRCYSLCDPRVRPIILFVKAWAKRRKVNSSYSGTLSSYGYVLMVLHYLVNIAQPAVLPNLQSSWRPYGAQPADQSQTFLVEGWHVAFWHNDEEIYAAAQKGMLTQNRDSLGSLLAGFFDYYSSQGGGVTFRWMQEVLSLRSIGGLLTKEEKGWVKAVTEEREGKRIQHRFLFCIEDPFELGHNVARTVTHNGIVAIRDEFRRAKRILQAVGFGQQPRDGELFAQLLEAEDFHIATAQLKANGPLNGPKPELIRDERSSALPLRANGQPHSRPPNHQHHGAQRQREHAHGPGRADSKPTMPAVKTRTFDVDDNEAFPTLGKASKAPKGKKAISVEKVQAEEYSEISGDQARMVLEEVKRKKDEAQAESTAMGAAAAVLEDSD